jgi:hypothetical protein
MTENNLEIIAKEINSADDLRRCEEGDVVRVKYVREMDLPSANVLAYLKEITGNEEYDRYKHIKSELAVISNMYMGTLEVALPVSEEEGLIWTYRRKLFGVRGADLSDGALIFHELGTLRKCLHEEDNEYNSYRKLLEDKKLISRA